MIPAPGVISAKGGVNLRANGLGLKDEDLTELLVLFCIVSLESYLSMRG